MENPKQDLIVEQVIDSYRERSNIGQVKYGTTLEENNEDDFLQHLKEELMDAVLYIQKLQSFTSEYKKAMSDKIYFAKKFNVIYNHDETRSEF